MVVVFTLLSFHTLTVTFFGSLYEMEAARGPVSFSWSKRNFGRPVAKIGEKERHRSLLHLEEMVVLGFSSFSSHYTRWALPIPIHFPCSHHISPSHLGLAGLGWTGLRTKGLPNAYQPREGRRKSSTYRSYLAGSYFVHMLSFFPHLFAVPSHLHNRTFCRWLAAGWKCLSNYPKADRQAGGSSYINLRFFEFI